MGNSKEIIERWYKNVISHTEVEKFWSITPESIEPKPEATKSNRSQRKAKEVAQEPIG
jgi:hypothetical protein